jgi:hypothetical protein
LKGLDDIIVGTDAQSSKPLEILAERRHHDDRSIRDCPHGGQNPIAVQAWKLNVEDDQIRRKPSMMSHAHLAIARTHDAIAFTLEISLNDIADLPLIFDDKHRQGISGSQSPSLTSRRRYTARMII